MEGDCSAGTPPQQQQQQQHVTHYPAVCARLLVQGFLQVRGTGYRKGRKGHPLPNIYRQVRRPEPPSTVAEFLGAYSCHIHMLLNTPTCCVACPLAACVCSGVMPRASPVLL